MGSLPTPPPPYITPPSYYPLPSSLSHGWFPLGPSHPFPPPSHPLALRLCVALAQRGRRRHTDGHADGQRAMQGCLSTPAPCWHRARARRPRSAHTNTHTLTNTQMCIWCRIISLNLLNFPTYRLSCTGSTHVQTLPRAALHATAHACYSSLKKNAVSPPTLCHSACQSQMFTRLSPTVPQHVLSRIFCTYTLS